MIFRPAIERFIWPATILLSTIGVIAVLLRLLRLHSPSQALDAGFTSHPSLTLLHIVPGLLFMILGPLQFVPSLRAARPALHRWSGRVFLACSLMIGLTALVMSPQMAIGGVNESVATTLFAFLFLFSLAKAFAAILRRDIARHREWMIRGFGIGLAVAFIRPIVGVFFATMRLTHLTPHEFFGTAFWLGFSIQTIAAEVWIQHTRASMHPAAKQI